MTAGPPLEWRLAPYRPLSDLIFRVLFSPIFIVGGLGHFVEHRQMLARIAESPWHDVVNTIGDPSLLLKLSGVVFVIFGCMLAAGIFTRLTAVVLFITLIPITIAVHIAPGHTGPLLKNVAILSGLVHFFVRGAGALSLDTVLARRGPQ